MASVFLCLIYFIDRNALRGLPCGQAARSHSLSWLQGAVESRGDTPLLPVVRALSWPGLGRTDGRQRACGLRAQGTAHGGESLGDAVWAFGLTDAAL